MASNRSFVLALLVALGVSGAPGKAFAEILSAVDSGFVTSAGGSAKGDGTIAPGATNNYSVGYELHYSTGALGMPPGSTSLAAMDKNNYFVFDLSSLPAAIATAKLLIPAGELESVDGVEMFEVKAPSAPVAALSDAGMLKMSHGAGPTAFDSPMDPAVGVAGALYGNIEGSAAVLASVPITTLDDGTLVEIPLSAGAVAYLNAFLAGPVLLGGSVSSIVPASGTPQQPFGFTAPVIPGSGPTVPKLEVTLVPEPSTFLLGLSAASILLLALRRRAATG